MSVAECHCFTLDEDRAKVLFCIALVALSIVIWIVDRWRTPATVLALPTPSRINGSNDDDRVGFIHCSRFSKLGKGTTRLKHVNAKLANLCQARLPQRLDDDEFADALDALFKNIDDVLLQYRGILVSGDEAGVAASRLLSLIYTRRLSVEVLVTSCPCFSSR